MHSWIPEIVTLQPPGIDDQLPVTLSDVYRVGPLREIDLMFIYLIGCLGNRINDVKILTLTNNQLLPIP